MGYTPTINTKWYWKLDGNSLDSSWNGNNGTATNITYVDGKLWQCASFNGSSSKIDISTALPSGRSVACTHNAWFKKGVGTNDYIIMWRWESTWYYYMLHTHAIVTTTSNNRSQSVTITSPQDTNWHMYTLVQDWTTNDTCWKLYIDWVYKATTAYGFSWLANWAAVHSIWYANWGYANWLIDEVIIEDRAWSATEVRNYYSSFFTANAVWRTRYRDELGKIDSVSGAFTLVQNIMPLMSSTADETNKALTAIPGINVTVSNSWYYDATYRPRQMYRNYDNTERCNVIQVSGTTTSNYTDSTYSARTQAYFTQAVIIKNIYFRPRNADFSVVPVDVSFQVSDDGTNFMTVKTLTDITWFVKNTVVTWTIDTPLAGKYFRILFNKKATLSPGSANVHGITPATLQFDALV